MVTQQERARLTELYKDDPTYAAAALAKSLVCLLMVAGVAVIGATSDFSGAAAELEAQQMREGPRSS
jgi:hypothetical protein